MRSYWRFVAVPAMLVAFAVACSAQAMVEHAAAAAVGTAGSVGGRGISNSIDKICRKTDAAMEKAVGMQTPAAPVKNKAAAAQNSVSIHEVMGSKPAAAAARKQRFIGPMPAPAPDAAPPVTHRAQFAAPT